ncbi:MAG: hypothetical protein AAGI23_16685 [Bacteroidota bacterium]
MIHLNNAKTILLQSYTKAELQQKFYTSARIFVKQQRGFLLSQGIYSKYIDLADQKVHSKESLAELCAIPFSGKTIYDKYKETLISEVALLLDEIVWVGLLHQDEIERRFGFSIYTATTRKMWNSYTRTQVDIKEQYKLFDADNAAGWYAPKPEFTLSLPLALRRLLATYYETPADAELTAVESPESTTYTFDIGEEDIHRLLPILQVYASQDNIKLTSKGRPVFSTVSKLRNKLDVNEFFPDEKDRIAKQLRSNLLAGLLISNDEQQIGVDISTLLRDKLFNNYKRQFESAPIILSYLKGIGFVSYDDLQSIEKELFVLLQKLPIGEWISLKNIDTFLRYSLVDLKPINEITVANKLYYVYTDPEQRYYSDKHYIRKDQYLNAISKPFLKGTLFLFAAFGLLDIKYDEVDMDDLGRSVYSPYDGLRYVRLTPLGAYVARISDHYDVPASSAPPSIKLSPDSLTIMVEADNNLSDTLLGPYANRISPTRFQTDFSTFLHEVSSKQGVEDKINMFVQFVRDELPPNWVSFFAELRQKVDPLEALPSINVFKIPQDNGGLIKLIARDTKLRELVVKAEGYHILIYQKDMRAFKKRLREFGYLLP